jgi:hypothetical protein
VGCPVRIVAVPQVDTRPPAALDEQGATRARALRRGTSRPAPPRGRWPAEAAPSRPARPAR